MKYTGTKYYNSSFLDFDVQGPNTATNSLVRDLVPGTRYNFEVNSISVCGESQPTTAEVTTKMSGKQTVAKFLVLKKQICVFIWRLKSLYFYVYYWNYSKVEL